MSMNNDKPKFPSNIKAEVISEHGPSRFNQAGLARGAMQNGNVEATVYTSQKLQDDVHKIGLKIQQHEANIKFLQAEKNRLDNSILDMQVALGKYQPAIESGFENEELSRKRSEQETIEQILRHEKSAAAIWYQLKTHHGTQGSHIHLMKDVLGIVAMLGKVEDDNLNRLLSDYLGLDTMLAIVCKTYDGIKALETYDTKGCINKSSGLNGLGASIGRPLDGRFLVICLGDLRPYAGGIIADDPQRKLNILKPRLPNGESPPGFLGYAVNMVNIEAEYLYCATSAGHNLRETLFYHLFSRLQVYSTREDMLKALPYIKDGAISMDGGMIMHNSVFALGKREVDVKFPKSIGRSNLHENCFEIKRLIKETKWKKERYMEDMEREQQLLDHANNNFKIRKQDYLNFLAVSSQAAQIQAGVGNLTCRQPSFKQERGT